MLFERYRSIEDPREAETQLAALLTSEAPFWVAEVARLRAAESGDSELLASAHAVLASIATTESFENAHRVAYARTRFLTGNAEACELALTEVLETDPANRYAVTLREELLRRRGKNADAAELLIRAAAHESDGRAIETLLLRASFLAEAANRSDLAHEALHRAAFAAQSLAALWLLRRNGARSGDRNVVLEALHTLGQQPAGEVSESARLQLAEHYAVGPDVSQARQTLSGLLDVHSVGLVAATWLAVLPGDDELRAQALARLVRTADGGYDEVYCRAFVIETAHGPSAGGEAAELVTDRAHASIGPWAAFSKLRALGFVPTANPAARRDALAELARVTSDARVAASLFFIAAWIDLVRCHGESFEVLRDELEDADDEGNLLAFLSQETWLDAGSPEPPVAPPTDLSEDSDESELDARFGRGLLLAGNAQEAVSVLARVVKRQPTNIAAWLALRDAARTARLAEPRIAACEALSERAANRSQQAALLEEAGITLLEELDLSKAAEVKLQAALLLDPRRDRAYTALSGILERRGDAEAQLEVVSRRAAALTDAEGLANALYEEALLRHRLGRQEEALDSLRSLKIVEPGHGPGLALSAHILALLQRYSEAVAALREVASVDLSVQSRRAARWAAARYLQENLNDSASALRELEIVDRMGSADPVLHSHMAHLAESSGRYAEAVQALERAASLSEGEQRSRYERRAATLQASKLNAVAAAAESYRRALTACPTDLLAAGALASLLERPGRKRAAQAFASAVWVELQRDPTHPETLRKLIPASEWNEDVDLEFLTLEALVFLGQASTEEHGRWTHLREMRPCVPSGRLTDEGLQILIGDLPSNPLAALALTTGDVLASAETKEPRTKRWKGNDTAKQNAIITWIEAFQGTVETLLREPKGDRVRLLPGGSGTWSIGENVTLPLSETVCADVAMLAVASRTGLRALVGQPLERLIHLVHALARSVGSPIGGAPSDVESTAERLRATLDRTRRNDIARMVATLDAESVTSACEDAYRRLLGVALLAAGSLEVARTQFAGQDEGTAVSFWLSPTHRQLRVDLGLDLARSPSSARAAVPPLERASGFFAGMSPPPEWSIDAVDVLRTVTTEKSHSDAGGQGAPGPSPDLAVQLGELHSFLESATGETKAQLALAAADMAARIGDARAVESYHRMARAASPDHLLALRAERLWKARTGSFDDVVSLLAEESRLATSVQRRALLLSVSALTRFETSVDARQAFEDTIQAASLIPEPGVPSLLATLLHLNDPDPTEASECTEALGRELRDKSLASVLLADAGRTMEKAGQPARSRLLFRRALDLDPTAFDAALSLARVAIEERLWDEAVDALERAIEQPQARPASASLRRVASRIAQLAAHRPQRALELLQHADHPIASEVAVEAAEAAGDDVVVRAALSHHAKVTRRSERAFALVSLAERAPAEQARDLLREAAQADPASALVRTATTESARLSSDARWMARSARGEGLGSLVAAARCTAIREGTLERRYLIDAAENATPPSVLAMVLATDAANDLATRIELIGRALDHDPTPGRIEPLIAIADIHERRGNPGAAANLLREALRRAPHHTIAIRTLISMGRTASRKAALWLEEAKGSTGIRAAFAACQAARWFGPATDRGGEALRMALRSHRGYPPALWLLEARARAVGDATVAREALLERAEASQRPEDAAAFFFRAALASAVPDLDLLERARVLVPEDVGLIDRMLRLGKDRLGPETQAELLEALRVGAAREWERVFRLRQALTLERAGDPTSAGAIVRECFHHEDPDPFFEWFLDRVEQESGKTDATLSRHELAAERATDDVTRALRLEAVAHLAEDAGQDRRAADAYRGVLERFPGHVPSTRALSRVLERLGELEALATLEEGFATVAPPMEAIAHARFALHVRRRGHLDSAPATKALLAVFDYAESDLWLAREVERIARANQQPRLLRKALSELADHFEEDERIAVELRVARVTGSEQGPGVAANQLARLGDEGSHHPLFREVLAALRLASGGFGQAADEFERAARSARSKRRRARLFEAAADAVGRTADDPRREVALLLASAAEQPENLDFIEKILSRGLGPEEEEQLLALLSRVPRADRDREVRRLSLTAAVEIGLGRPEAAKGTLTRLVHIAPTAEHLARLAEACEADGDWRGAARAVQQRVTDAGDPADQHRLFLRLGDLWERARDLRRASDSVRQALALRPDDGATARRLADLQRMLGGRR